MADVLEFALGLQTSEFLSGLGISTGKLLTFAGLAETVRKAWDHTWETIGTGAELRGLSSATGESVKNLYMFQHGLEAIGGQTQSLPMFFMLVQKALSGVNDAGNKTDILFSQIGLNMEKLRAEDSVQALTDIAGALHNLPQSQAAAVGEQLFGRFQAETVLQMANNMKTFKEAMASGGNTGALLDKFSKTFENVKAAWGDILGDVEGIWAAIAGAIAPELEKIFNTVHADIVNIGPALSGAIAGGHVRELLGDALNAAFEQAGYYGERIFEALAAAFGVELKAVMDAAFEDVIPHFFGKLKSEYRDSNLDARQQGLLTEQSIAQDRYLALSKNGAPAGEVAAALANVRQIGVEIADITTQVSALDAANDADFRTKISDALGKAQTSAGGIYAAIVNSWQSTGTGPAPHAALDKFLGEVKALTAAGIAPGAGGPVEPPKGPNAVISPENHSKPEFTSLEKMGFIMSGSRVRNPYDHQKISLLQKIVENTSPQRQRVYETPMALRDVSGDIANLEMGFLHNKL